MDYEQYQKIKASLIDQSAEWEVERLTQLQSVFRSRARFFGRTGLETKAYYAHALQTLDLFDEVSNAAH